MSHVCVVQWSVVLSLEEVVQLAGGQPSLDPTKATHGETFFRWFLLEGNNYHVEEQCSKRGRYAFVPIFPCNY